MHQIMEVFNQEYSVRFGFCSLVKMVDAMRCDMRRRKVLTRRLDVTIQARTAVQRRCMRAVKAASSARPFFGRRRRTPTWSRSPRHNL